MYGDFEYDMWHHPPFSKLKNFSSCQEARKIFKIGGSEVLQRD